MTVKYQIIIWQHDHYSLTNSNNLHWESNNRRFN